MSTSPRPDESAQFTPAVKPSLHLEMAAHLGSWVGATKEACVSAVREEQALCYVAHYTRGVFDLGVDAFDETEAQSGTQPLVAGRDELKRLGRQLSSVTTQIARTLQNLRTGRLWRAALRTNVSSIFCDLVLPSQTIVAIVADTPGHPLVGPASPVRPGARATASDVVTALTRRLRENTVLSTSPELPKISFRTHPSRTSQRKVTVFVPRPAQKLIDACKTAVRHDGLQLVACWSHGAVTLMVDQLDHPLYAELFEQSQVHIRRRHYQGLSEQLGTLANRLNRSTATAPMCGRLDGMTLNVERGAIYCLRVGPGDYLIGITVQPNNVSSAQQMLSALAGEFSKA
jgi:hypothetical protein